MFAGNAGAFGAAGLLWLSLVLGGCPTNQAPLPEVPSNPSPADEAGDVSVDADLDWADAEGATSYDVYFGTTDPPPLVGNTATSAWTLDTLDYGTTYHWQVVAKNDTGSTPGAEWSFATQPPPPDAPSDPSPADEAGDVSIDADLDWADAEGATSYDVYFGTTDPPPLVGNTDTSAWGLGALSYGTTYYWRIVARNATGSTTGPVWSFVTPPSGAIVAWGANNDGQCNVPAPNGDFIAVATVGSHNLGLKADGSIAALGDNTWGQCNVPAPNSSFVAVGAGWYHSLGLKADGSTVAWGDNVWGQCDVPAPDSGFVAVAAGGGHNLGLKADGSIVAWGRDNEGQCDVPTPNSGFVAVAGGGYHSLGLKADGSIVAWGRNNEGQCDVPAPNSDFVAVAGGAYHSLGLKADGSIVAWGRNDEGQCNVPAPNSGFEAVAGGGYHSLGLKADGSIVAWGDNAGGQCDVPTPNNRFFAVAGGESHSLALRE